VIDNPPYVANSQPAFSPVPAASIPVRPKPMPVVPSGRYRKGAVWGWILGLLVIFGSAYVGAQWYLSDRVPGGATVAGVELGGLNRAEATELLQHELGALSRQPIPLRAGAMQTTLDPVAAGVTFNADKTIDQLTEFSLNPMRLVTHLRSDYGEVPLAVEIEQPRFNAAASRAASALGQTPVNGTVIFTDGIAATTAAREGQTVDREAIAYAVTNLWLHQPSQSGDRVIPVEAQGITPQITQAATDAAYSLARQIAGGPITVQVGQESVLMPAATVTEATTFLALGGELVPQFNGQLLTAALLKQAPDLLHDPENARFIFEDDRPVIVPGRNGTDFEPEDVREAISEAALSGTRVANVTLVETPPELSTSDLEALGVNEIVSSFATVLTADRVRTENLRRGGELITGKLLLPGETFSLTDTISPITAENGFGNAGVIVAGNFTEGMGGGLSQLATTAYNAGFFAGFEDIEHRPHSLFINRYPAGREATLVLGSLDMKFRNNTPHGALLQSWVGPCTDFRGVRSNSCIHVAVWSTPYFRVETQMSERTEPVESTIEERSGPQCVNQSRGPNGFLVSNARQVFRLDNGEQVINEVNRWRYRPTNGIRCVG